MSYHVQTADGRRLENITLQEIGAKVASGEIVAAGSLAWTAGMADWAPLSQVLGLPPVMPASGGDALGSIIPVKNGKALTAYYCAIFGLIPCVTVILGPLALIMGIQGLKAVKRNPGMPGTVHAWVGIILGGIETALVVLWLVFFLIGLVAGLASA